MFRSVQEQLGAEEEVSIDIAPLIDVVFILLIFFLVTATFMNDSGIPLTRAEARNTEPLPTESLRINISTSESIYIKGKKVSLSDIPQYVRNFNTGKERANIIIVADENVSAKKLISVMDEIRSAGSHNIALATRKPSNEK